MEEFYQRKKSKYTWADKDFDDWCKKQTSELEKIGFRASTAGVTRMLYNKIIIPNEIKLSDLIKEDISLKKRKKNVFK